MRLTTLTLAASLFLAGTASLFGAAPTPEAAPRSAFAAIFGQPEPADLRMLRTGAEASGQIVFTLDRPWDQAAADLQAMLKAQGVRTYAMPGTTDMLVFGSADDQQIILFVQQNPTDGTARIVVNN